jgi:hypothetical protein
MNSRDRVIEGINSRNTYYRQLKEEKSIQRQALLIKLIPVLGGCIALLLIAFCY